MLLKTLLRTTRLVGTPRSAQLENTCRFVSSRGLMRSCELHMAEPRSSVSRIPRPVRLGFRAGFPTIHLNTDMVERFVRRHLPHVSTPFTLVTGDSDMPVEPGEHLDAAVLEGLLSHALLTGWYAQNCVLAHPKLHPIPIGLDYHTISSGTRGVAHHPWGPVAAPRAQECELRAVAGAAPDFSERMPQAFANWHFAIDRGNRKACKERVDPRAVSYQEAFSARNASWRENAQYAFTLSPFGIGLDCHRTWEALVLGTVPIVQRSSLDVLYDDLPVLIVDDWSEVRPERLVAEQSRMSRLRFDFSRLDLAWWVAKIRGDAPPPPAMMTIGEFVGSAFG